MKKILLVFFFTSLVSNAQNISLLKEVATKNTDTIGAIQYSKQLLKDLPQYEYYNTSLQAGTYFVSFSNINDKNNDRIVLVFAPSKDEDRYSFVEIRGFTQPILNIWKENFKSNSTFGAFKTYDRFKDKENGLNFSIYVYEKSSSIKNFS